MAHAETVTLASLEERALQNRPVLEADAARARGAQADIRRAAAAYQPQAVLKGDSTYAPGRVLTHIPDQKHDPNDPDYWIWVSGTRKVNQGGSAFAGQLRTGIELDVNASLYNFGRTGAAVDAGKAAHQSVVAQGEVTRAQIIRGVRGAYLNWLSAHELAKFSSQTAKEAGERRARVEALISEGVRPKGEVTPARADELLTKLEDQRAQGDLASAKLMLEQAVGAPLSESAEPDLALLEPNHPALRPGEGDDPEGKALASQQTAAGALSRMHKSANRPEIGLALAAGVRNQATSGTFPLYSAGLVLSVPLWDGGLSKANAESARAQAAQIEAQGRAHEQDRQNARALADVDAREALSRFDTAKDLLDVCDTRLKEVESGYELGAATIDQISQARSMLRRAQTELLLAQVAHAEARLRVAAVGPGERVDSPE